MDRESTIPRLQSLKVPRDFSLGLKTNNKKSKYAPNLNAVRNKDKNKEAIKKNEQKRKGKQGRDRLNNVNHKQNLKERYVQSEGVFSGGTAEGVQRHVGGSWERYSSNREAGSSAANIILPTINKNSNWNVNVKNENLVFNDLVKTNDSDEDDEDVDSFFNPVPLVPQVKYNDLAKEEEHSIEDLKRLYNLSEPFNKDCYNEENPAISLVKLPDSFAGKGLSDDPNNKKLFDYTLDGMLEGQIGKLIVRKSGKMEVQIGRIKYDLTEDHTYESKEELVTIVDNGSQYSITVLGKVLNNFIMCPDYETLLK